MALERSHLDREAIDYSEIVYMMRNALAVILAGGKGSRLEPLTRDRAKPAVPFGGNYRIIDFVLSNCINSGLRRMLVQLRHTCTHLCQMYHTQLLAGKVAIHPVEQNAGPWPWHPAPVEIRRRR